MGTIAIAQPTIRLRSVPLGMLTDERLAALVGDGDDAAFATLYERYRAPLSRYCRSIVRDPEEAADAFQNTMVSALRGLQRDAPSGPVRPWLYRIAHNESISLLRRHRPDEHLVDELPELPSGAHDAQGVRERLAGLLADLRQLPERQRGALVMRELAGLEYGEIGRVFDTSAVAARKAVYEARVSLATLEEGRGTDCREIQRQLSDGDGRARRARRVRGHLQVCTSCAQFDRGIRDRRRALALLPVLPGAPLAAALAGSVGGGGAGKALIGGGAAVGGGASAVGGASILGSGAFAVKCLGLCSAIAAVGAGALVASHAGQPVAHTPVAVARMPHAVPRSVGPVARQANHVNVPAARAAHPAVVRATQPSAARRHSAVHAPATPHAAFAPSAHSVPAVHRPAPRVRATSPAAIPTATKPAAPAATTTTSAPATTTTTAATSSTPTPMTAYPSAAQTLASAWEKAVQSAITTAASMAAAAQQTATASSNTLISSLISHMTGTTTTSSASN